MGHILKSRDELLKRFLRPFLSKGRERHGPQEPSRFPIIYTCRLLFSLTPDRAKSSEKRRMEGGSGEGTGKEEERGRERNAKN